MGTSLLVGVASALLAAAPTFAQEAGIETVTITGYRASLADATNAKRASVGFIDTVFAEDIGKFPDTNIAESLNRIPGVTISREIDGEGVNVQIRGLGSSFTKVLLNGAQVTMGSTGTTDAQGTNREVDLNMLPSELFTQLTVHLSPLADTLEGGAAGTVDMRTMRPFDKPGLHFTYSAQGTAFDHGHAEVGPRGTLIVSDTEGPFGLLVGLTGQINHMYTTGFETIGWTTPKLNAAMCPAADCGSIGGGNWTIPATVPANVTTGGLVPGQTINQALLMSLNPGLTVEQISKALIPRLGRPMYEKGTRSRYNAIVSAEYRPSDNLHFYIDFIGGRLDNNLDRSDIDWVGRNGSMIPENLKIDSNGVVTSGVFANSQFFLEARPYKEKEDFLSLNPGMDWQVTDLLHVSLKANVARSHFFRDSPTILVNTPASSHTTPLTAGDPVAPAGGAFVTYTNTSMFPTEAFNIDLNNPANFTWQGGRVNVQDEKRYTYTNGIHGDVEYGGDEMNVKAGFAYDEAYRNITGYNNDAAWQASICGDGPSVLPAGNSSPGCNGLNVTGPALTGAPGPGPAYDPRNPAIVAAGLPTYFLYNAAGNGLSVVPNVYPAGAIYGLGAGSTVGSPALTYQGSSIPQSALANYLMTGPNGFITANYAKIKADSHYASFDYPNAPVSGGSNTGANAGLVDEKNWGAYAELNGMFPFFDRDLKYNVGLRWVQTRQLIGGFVSHADPRNNVTVYCGQPAAPISASCLAGHTTIISLPDGAKYPSYNTFATTLHTYHSILPSLSLVYNVADNWQIRGSLSRTMTRPNPSAMLPGVSFGDPSAAQVGIGNPALAPYYSNNIDLGVEYYTGGEGYIGASYFHKNLSGFTVLGNTTEPFSFLAQYGITYSTVNPTQQAALQARGCTSDSNCNTTVIVQEQVNASGHLHIEGVEFDWVQPLDFLLADYGLKGFGFTANMTIVGQVGTGSGAPAIATGVSPFTDNATIYYENNGIMLRLSHNYNAKTYASGSNQNGICLPTSSSAGCPQGAYLFGAPYAQTDFSSSLKLSTLFGDIPTDPELTFDIQNLFKAKQKSYFQYPSAPFTYYDRGSFYLFGLRGTF
ncbi:MAG: TonB-dependent receptor [Alphaproteobacteria bacterium]|nr:TonB-dependent receptor [Alphaproteobacteria bacterium]